ncbi:MAG: hypothetical protein ACRC46_01935 [Thermoguttaceae bacterium]
MKLFQPFRTMSLQNRTPYQDKIIKRYYDNRSDIAGQRLQELVTDLYLSEGKKRLAIWKRITAALENLKVPQDKIDHLVAKDDAALLAKFIEKLS